VNILQKLTIRHLKRNRSRTVITVVGIVLSVAMVTAVSGMVASFQDMLYQDSVLKEGLWHVRYKNVDPVAAGQLVQEPVFSEWEWVETEEGAVLSLQFARLHRGVFDESEAVCLRYGVAAEDVSYHNNLLIAKGILPGPYYNALYGFAGILLVLVALGSVLVISNAFAISSDQRSLQFGLLKSAGATRSQIQGMVLFEGAALAALAIPLGILTGFFAEWVALSVANSIFAQTAAINFVASFRVVVSPAALGVTVPAALITIFFAAWGPAVRAARVSAVEAIRQTKSVKLSPRRVRVSPLTARLFGFEGLLAAKTMKRNRGKYRTTMLALVVSIVLFIGVSSFGQILLQATGMVYEDMGSNVLLTMMGDTASRHDALLEEITGWGGARVYPSRELRATTQLPGDYMTQTFRETFAQGERPVRLYSMGDEEFARLCRQLRVDPAEYRDPARPKALLLNTTGTYIKQGRRMSFTPYRIPPGTWVFVTASAQSAPVEIQGETDEIPIGVYARFYAGALNLVVTDEVLLSLRGEADADSLWAAVMAEDAEVFSREAEEFLSQNLPYDTYSVLNYEEMAGNNRNFGVLVMTFVYGFIAMLSLIGVTSVITTISTGIALRGRELAMLRSVGMCQRAIAKMLNYESLLYGIKALALGIPLGLAVCGLLYKAMTSVMDFPFLWPVDSILISVVAVLALTFATMAYARRKQRRTNLAGALRDDVL